MQLHYVKINNVYKYQHTVTLNEVSLSTVTPFLLPVGLLPIFMQCNATTDEKTIIDTSTITMTYEPNWPNFMIFNM